MNVDTGKKWAPQIARTAEGGKRGPFRSRKESLRIYCNRPVSLLRQRSILRSSQVMLLYHVSCCDLSCPRVKQILVGFDNIWCNVVTFCYCSYKFCLAEEVRRRACE